MTAEYYETRNVLFFFSRKQIVYIFFQYKTVKNYDVKKAAQNRKRLIKIKRAICQQNVLFSSIDSNNNYYSF